jgi:hypothetical protein
MAMAMAICDELLAAGYNRDCCSLVWNTTTCCRLLIGLLLVIVFIVFDMKDFCIDKYMPGKEHDSFQ